MLDSKTPGTDSSARKEKAQKEYVPEKPVPEPKTPATDYSECKGKDQI